ncbi:MAG: hypothetical protein KDJ37_09515 [Hyphomicrobiaceae bacterium]|nr:hypothetical protein [Hyphomicrobiaceae bacterium]
MLTLLKAAKPKVSFLCAPEDKGVIAEPVPAKSAMPEWFRRLPPIDKSQVHSRNNGLTVKRCMPFLDALTTGFILPLAATVRLEVRDGGQTVDAGWEIDRVMVSNHANFQVAGNAKDQRPPCKFHNYWTIVTPPGWSCLFLPPLNRPNDVFEVVAGIVDTDTYTSLIHFPFFATDKDGLYTLERGTPLVQVIPFKRSSTHLDADIRVETADEAAAKQRILRNTQASEGWYRKFARAIR